MKAFLFWLFNGWWEVFNLPKKHLPHSIRQVILIRSTASYVLVCFIAIAPSVLLFPTSSNAAEICDKTVVGVATSFQYPTHYHVSGQDFQPKEPPNPGCGNLGKCPPGHLGEDWQIETAEQYNDKGMPVYAIANGCVTASGFNNSWGGYMVMKHYLPNDSYLISIYGHLKQTKLPSVGSAFSEEKVKEPITYTANSEEMKTTDFGPHLHFEIRGTKGQLENTTNADDNEIFVRGYKKLSENNFLEGGNGIIAYKQDFGGYFNPSELIEEHHEGSRNPKEILNHRGFIDYLATPEHFEDFLCVFTDIIEGKQEGAHQEAIKKLCLEGIIKGNGDGTFAPLNPVTRAEFSKLIALTKLVDEKGVKPGRLPIGLNPTDNRMWNKTQLELNVAIKPIANYFIDELKAIEDKGDAVPEVPFADVPADQWYYPYVNILARLRIVDGYPVKNSLGKVFQPGNPVTRAQMVKMVLKGLAGKDYALPEWDKSYWAQGYLKCALNLKHGSAPNDDYRLILPSNHSTATGNNCDIAYQGDVERELCYIGNDPATRAETAFAIHRLREFRAAGGDVANSCDGL